MSDKAAIYRQLRAVDVKYFHTCFYCGCIAYQDDLVPPLKLADFYLRTREEADYYKVPACKECLGFLKSEKGALLGQRVDVVKRMLARKYQRAIRIYELWDASEVNELSYQLKHSVNAGIVLGKESTERIAFKGFDFEVDGEQHFAKYVSDQEYKVFELTFENFRSALDYASKAYSIPKAKLIEMYTAHNDSFDSAINFHHEAVARKLFEKTLKEKCKDFALKHKQNLKFVMRTVELFCQQDETLTIEMALVKLHRERVPKAEDTLLTPCD